MRLIFVFLIILASIQTQALVNGKALKGELDIVRIRLNNGHVCSGVFIDPFAVLTAAHCASAPENFEAPNKNFLEGEADQRVPVKILKLISHPEFKSGFFPYADIGIIKTEKNPYFVGNFKLNPRKQPLWGQARLFGTGRIRAYEDKYYRTTGENYFLSFSQYIFFLGQTESKSIEENTGENVSIAHSDSGGTIVDPKDNTIIAVNTQSSVNQSHDFYLPTLATGTWIYAAGNFEFIQKNMGELKP